MRKKLFMPVAIAVLSAASQSSLAAIMLNGSPIESFNIVTAANGDVLITTQGFSVPVDPPPTEPPPTEPPPTEPPPTEPPPTEPPGECPTPAGNVNITETLDWSKPSATVAVGLGKTEIKAMPIVSTGNPGYAGRVSFAAATGTSGVTRKVWFSTCPGGEPLADPMCETTGTSSTDITWIQQPNAGFCSLSTGTQYYVNIQNQNCNGSSCSVRRVLWTNGKP